MVVHAHSPSASAVEAGRSGVQTLPQLCSGFEASLGYMRDPVSNKMKLCHPEFGGQGSLPCKPGDLRGFPEPM